MLCISVQLLGNSYRADPDGSRSHAEWPPAPSRVLDSLTDAGNGDRAVGWDALEGLYAAAPPVVYATSRFEEQVDVPNYAATQGRGTQEVQAMPGRDARLVQRGPKVCIPDPEVQFVWPDVELPEHQVDALAWRAARVGYLGSADSKALMSIADRPPAEGFDAAKRWEPVPEGAPTGGCVLVNVGSRDHLDAALRAHRLGDPRDRRRARQRRSRCWYRPPDFARPPGGRGGNAVWLEFGDSLPAGMAVKVAHALKAALMRRWADHEPGGPPWWITGHETPRDRDYQLARFLVLPAVGHDYADGRLQGACVWVPEVGDSEREAMAAALARTLGVFHVPGFGDIRTSETDPQSGRRRWAAAPTRWIGPARRWVTALPGLSDRHGFPVVADAIRWCVQAGLPEPDPGSVEVSRNRLLPGGIELRTHQLARPKHRSTRGYAHVRFTLAEPVMGPVVVGAGRSFGLGLCAPQDEPGESGTEL